MLREAYAGLPPGPLFFVKKRSTQSYAVAHAEDPSPRLRSAIILLLPNLTTNSLKAKKMGGAMLLICVLWVLWRHCMTNWAHPMILPKIWQENSEGELLIKYSLKPS